MFIAFCNLRDNLPSSFRILDATFCERLLTPKHKMYVFSQRVLFPSYHNHIYHRFPKFLINTLKLEKIVYWTVCSWCDAIINYYFLGKDGVADRSSLCFVISLVLLSWVMLTIITKEVADSLTLIITRTNWGASPPPPPPSQIPREKPEEEN